jgi:hypothetical protein
MISKRVTFTLVSLIFAFAFSNSSALAQEIADPEFKAIIAHPAYSKSGPRVLFDEGHNNSHTSHGRYKPFADLIGEDGYYVVTSRKTFTKESLATFKIIIVVNALGAEDVDDEGADRPAFTDGECEVVREWVKSGGALLLIAGPAPFGKSAENLAKQFGVEIVISDDKGLPVQDGAGPGTTVYSREGGFVVDHPITQGRNDGEKVSRVVAVAGQALKTAEAGGVFLKVDDHASAKGTPPGKDALSAGGAEGIALKAGKGRVVVLGEPEMISAQLSGHEKSPIGMNYPGVDNRQLALNIMHWLSGLLRER